MAEEQLNQNNLEHEAPKSSENIPVPETSLANPTQTALPQDSPELAQRIEQLAKILVKSHLAINEHEGAVRARVIIENEEKLHKSMKEKGYVLQPSMEGLDDDRPLSELLDEQK